MSCQQTGHKRLVNIVGMRVAVFWWAADSEKTFSKVILV